MIKEELENRVREYLAEHSEYSEVFGQTFVAVDTLTAMVDFAEQETKELEKENTELKSGCGICYRKDKENLTKAKEIIKKFYPFVRDKCYTTTFSENKERQSLIAEAEQFLKDNKVSYSC